MITKTHHFIPSSTGMIPVVCAPLWSASPGAHRGKLSDRQQSWCLRRASAPKNRDPAVKRPEIPAIYNSNLWNDHNPIYSHKWAIKINPDNGFEAFISGHSKTHWNARRTVPKKTMRWSNVTHGFLMRCKARAEVKDVETPAPNQHQPAHTEHLLHRCKPRNPKPPIMTTFMAQALKSSGTKHLSL